MLPELDFRALEPSQWVLPRASSDVSTTIDAVAAICEDVRIRGVEAVLDYGEKFDGIRPSSIRVPDDVITNALDAVDAGVRVAIEESIRRLRLTCEAELIADVTTTVAPQANITSRNVAVGRVGLYVPGGLAPLISTVVMNVVPAQVAGVRSIALASPPQDHGWPNQEVLAACALLGIDEVYAAGGAQALAMFAYGTPECVRVNMITGPGNIYVAAAKRYLQGTVAIDAEAGPSEIAVLADSSAEAKFVAADLISQAEHDPLAASILVTDSEQLIADVKTQVEKQLANTKHQDRVRAALSGNQSALVLVSDMKQGLAVVNAYGAEHLEIHTANARELADRVENAGAVFVGPYSPVSLGDYVAGSNHVLPTSGSAAHSSGLSVRSFIKTMHVIDYSEPALREVAKHAQTLAAAEDLPAHGAAIAVRFES